MIRNDRNKEAGHRIHAGNQAYYIYKSIMKRKEISRKTKMRIYRVAIRSVVTYGAGRMILTKDEEEKVRRFERKVYSSKKVMEGVNQRLMSTEVREKL